MPLKTTVKVSGVTNLHDARYCAGMGVELVGFPVAGANAVSAEDFAEIAGWLSGVRFVAEVGEASADLSAYAFDLAQTDDPAALSALARHGKPLILRLSPEAEGGAFDYALARAVMERSSGQVEYFLMESGQEGLSPEDCDALKALCADFPVLLGFGLTAENASAAIEEIAPAGLALRPGAEIKVGYNDFDTLADVLEAIEVD